MATGTKTAPKMYCKRCWTAGTVHQGARKRKGRCEPHHLEIRAETQLQRQEQKGREQDELRIDSLIFTELKWLSKQTGAGYADSDDELHEILFGTFDQALHNIDAPTPEDIAAATQAALTAFTAHTGRQPAIAPCPGCQDRNPESRRGNDFTCVQCGWTTLPGTFGAAHTFTTHTPLRTADLERATLLQQLKTDYGFEDIGWANVAGTFHPLSTEHIRSILQPTETQLRLSWVTCTNCDELHEHLEPVERPEYQAALAAARARNTSQ